MNGEFLAGSAGAWKADTLTEGLNVFERVRAIPVPLARLVIDASRHETAVYRPHMVSPYIDALSYIRGKFLPEGVSNSAW